MAEALARLAVDRNAAVHWGRCWEGDGAPAFWPWIQVIRSHLQATEPESLREQMGLGAADVAQIVPEVRLRLPEVAAPAEALPAAARFRLFDSVTTFFKRAAEHRPLVLILEDIHRADTSSLLLLEFIAPQLQDGRLLVMATYRDVEVGREHPLSDVLGELSRHPWCERLALRGLCEDDVLRLMELTIGRAPAGALASRVSSVTAGNPFFVAEIVRWLCRAERPSTTPPEVGVPPALGDVIRRRLAQMSEECRQVLTVASVIGPEFGLNLLERLSLLARRAAARGAG